LQADGEKGKYVDDGGTCGCMDPYDVVAASAGLDGRGWGLADWVADVGAGLLDGRRWGGPRAVSCRGDGAADASAGDGAAIACADDGCPPAILAVIGRPLLSLGLRWEMGKVFVLVDRAVARLSLSKNTSARKNTSGG
jgi:hypothetical protein